MGLATAEGGLGSNHGVLRAGNRDAREPSERALEKPFEADGGVCQGEELFGVPVHRIGGRVTHDLVEICGE